MSSLHVAGTLLAGAALVGLGLIALVAAIADRSAILWVDRLLLLFVTVTAATALAGLLLFVAGSQQTEPLHYVYAIAAILVPAGGRYLVRAWTPRRMMTGMFVATLVTLGLLLRLQGTGS
jgi:hypothetical protein